MKKNYLWPSVHFRLIVLSAAILKKRLQHYYFQSVRMEEKVNITEEKAYFWPHVHLRHVVLSAAMYGKDYDIITSTASNEKKSQYYRWKKIILDPTFTSDMLFSYQSCTEKTATLLHPLVTGIDGKLILVPALTSTDLICGLVVGKKGKLSPEHTRTSLTIGLP